MARYEPKFLMRWRQQARQFRKEVQVFYFVFKHPGTPWYLRWTAACSVAYVFSPVQLIPNFIPVIGFLDDFIALYVAAKILRRFTPGDLLRECRELAQATEDRRKNKSNRGRPQCHQPDPADSAARQRARPATERKQLRLATNFGAVVVRKEQPQATLLN